MDAPSGTVTIMFTDLVGSSALGDRLGDVEAQALRRAHERILRREFERFEGRVVKDTGDGFLVAFASARQGVQCAVEVQRAIVGQQAEGRYGELNVRIGLHTGEPVAEAGDLHGSDVDLAARVEAAAEGGQILVSDSTYILARRSPGLDFSSVGERTLKGFADPVELFEVRWSQLPKLTAQLTRFVGRQRESAKLREHIEAVIGGRGSLVLVGGEAGVGKTRLVSELATYATDRGLRVLSGRAYETEGMPPYLPFTEALEPFVRRCRADELRTYLNGNAPYVARLLPVVRQLLPDVTEPPSLNPDAERYRLFESVSEFMVKASKDIPTLLFLDDLHWADAGTVSLFQHLGRRLGDGRLLAIGTYRETEVDSQHPVFKLLADLRREHLGTLLALKPFGREEAVALVEAVLGTHAASHVLDVVCSASEGNPFFLEELVRHLQEQGRDLSDPQGPVGDWDIPAGVRQVIGKRLARLGEEANRVLAYSSVLGRDLSLSKVAAVTGRDEDSLLDSLDEALAAQVVREEGQGYAFSHPLIQETLYQGLSAARRRQLHRRVGEALEAHYGDDLEPHLAELAHHFYQAVARSDLAPGSDAMVAKVIDYASRAGDGASALSSNEEAARLYQMALQALELQDKPDDSKREMRSGLQARRGVAFSRLGAWPNARSALEAALDDLPAAALERRAELLVDLCIVTFWQMDTPSTRRQATEGLELGDRFSRQDVVVRAMGKLAECDAADGDVGSALKGFEAAIGRARGLRHPAAVYALQHSGLNLYWCGKIEEAVERTLAGAEMARDLNDLTNLMSALPHLGLALVASGRYAEAGRAFDEAREVGRKYQIGTLLARSTAMSAGLHMELFDFAGAEEIQEEAREMARSLGFTPPVVSAGIDLLLNFARRGEPDRAEKLVHDVAEAVTKGAGWHAWLWKLRFAEAQAELALARGEWEEAARLSREAMDLSRAKQRVKYVVAALGTRGEALAALGRKKEAIADLHTAVELARSLKDPAMLLKTAAALMTLDGDETLAAEAGVAAERIIAALPDAELRRRFEAAEPVRLVLAPGHR